MYFSEHKGVVEIDEKGHTGRNQKEQNERQIKIEKHPEYKFFHRINPDAKGFDIFSEISKIQNYITQSNKETLKELENIITNQEEKTKEQENKIKKTKEQVCKRIIELRV